MKKSILFITVIIFLYACYKPQGDKAPVMPVKDHTGVAAEVSLEAKAKLKKDSIFLKKRRVNIKAPIPPRKN